MGHQDLRDWIEQADALVGLRRITGARGGGGGRGPQDPRGWIEQVDALGELRRITGARWEDEIGPITELAQHREDGPCVLFDEIPGFPRGYRVLVNSLGSLRRAALTLHME